MANQAWSTCFFVESIDEEKRHRNEITKRTYVPNPGEKESEDSEELDSEELNGSKPKKRKYSHDELIFKYI